MVVRKEMLWKATFIVGNYIFEKPISIKYVPFPGREIKFEAQPNGKGTEVSITFDTEQVSKPPVLQRRQAIRFFTMFKEISAPFIAGDLDAELVKMTPVKEDNKKKYNEMESPKDWSSYSPKPEVVKGEVIERIEKSFMKIHTGGMISGKEATKYHNLLALRNALKWYSRSLEFKGLLDRFVSLWVTFNIIYDYLWKHHNPKEKLPYHSDRILDCIQRSLCNDECKQILEPHKYFLPRQMPPYELAGTKKELEALWKLKDINLIEDNHNRFLAKEKQDLGFNTRDFLGNKYGLDFGKYFPVEDWVNSLAQVLLNIYGLRNMVFHSGTIPMEVTEGIVDNPEDFQYWDLRNDILEKVNALLLKDILNQASNPCMHIPKKE